MWKIKLIILICFFTLLTSCNKKIIGLNNIYKTEFKVYYASDYGENFIIYTENEIFVCSFNGTNYLFEKNKDEEILSTTAPIRIINQYKYDKDGNKTEIKQSYEKY